MGPVWNIKAFLMSHKCRLFCWRCYHPVGDLGNLAEVLSSAPLKILMHHRLFPLNEDLEERIGRTRDTISLKICSM